MQVVTQLLTIELMRKKQYTKPIVLKLEIDNSISLVMMTRPPMDPMDRSGSRKGADNPFSSPFGDKPFS